LDENQAIERMIPRRDKFGGRPAVPVGELKNKKIEIETKRRKERKKDI
jgi:hypothetical protein